MDIRCPWHTLQIFSKRFMFFKVPNTSTSLVWKKNLTPASRTRLVYSKGDTRPTEVWTCHKGHSLKPRADRFCKQSSDLQILFRVQDESFDSYCYPGFLHNQAWVHVEGEKETISSSHTKLAKNSRSIWYDGKYEAQKDSPSSSIQEKQLGSQGIS